MQNVVHNSNCDSTRDSEINEAAKQQSGSSSPLSGNISLGKGPSVASIQTHFMSELSESDDDDVSEVESFILEQAELDEEPGLDASKFLLTDDSSENGIDVETQCRLEALLEASGNFFENGQLDSACSASTSYAGIGKLALAEGKQYSNQEVLRRLTSSVSCALDEAAAALSRMRSEPHSSDQGDCRSLAEACSDGDINTVKRLLDEGRNVNEVTEEGESLLSLACSSGYYELAQLLLAMKANVEDRGLKDTTPLMEAASSGHIDIIQLLIQHGADVNSQTSQEKKLKGAKIKNQDMSMKPQQDIHGTLPAIVCPEGNTPLMFACAAGHEAAVKVLLDAGAKVEDHNENGHTPLMEAASAGHVEVAKLLVERGASINTHSNEFKESALTLACYKGHLEMVRFLLEAGADREHKTDEMHTALMEASMDGHVEVARLLLDSGAQVNMPADSFESPLTLAACGGHVELAMLLLERGANIEEVNDEGYTPLMEAAREGHEEMVALLLSQGADINAQTEETQETALTLACCGGFLEVADFLIKAGADYEMGASTPLMEAAQEGHLELVKYLINAGANVNATTATGDSALTYACENGHTDVADLLLQACAKLEHESEGGRTPLMKAARAGHLCTVQFLISKGANVNKQTTNNDHNPLSLACAGGHLNIVELLLSHGADPTHKLKDNSTMLIEASKGGHTAVVQLLLDYPNNMISTPPPPPEVSHMTNVTLDTTEAPRVPPHGLQVFEQNSYLTNVQSVPRIQELLQARDSLLGSPQAVPKQKSLQRKNVVVKNTETPSSSYSDAVPRYHYRSKSNAAAQVNSMSIQTDSGNLNEFSAYAAGGGGGNLDNVDDKELKPSERLEACINSMMKKAEMLHPSPEEQILQKQQILEELQRVERELQEKAQAQLLLTAQHQQQHHQSLQGLSTITTGTPTITTLTSNSSNSFPNVSATQAQQLLINSGAVLDIESISSLTDMSSMSNHLGLNLRTNLGGSSLVTPTFPQAVHPQQVYQHSKPNQQSVVTTTTSASDYCKGMRLGKQAAKQAKATPVMKQTQQHYQNHLQNAIKIQSSGHLDEIEKLNLRNAVLTEQQHQQQIQFQQQLLHQHPQEQFVLSEFTQNLTLRSSEYCAGAIDGLMHAVGGGIKLTSDSTQTHTIPMFDPVTVGQALLQQQIQQQQQLQQQHLTHAIQQENKRQQQHFEKNIKVLKGKTNKIQQQSLLHATQPPMATFQTQQSQAIKQQITTSCGETCTLVGNIPLEATGVLTLSGVATQTFPVSLAVSPESLQSPVSVATSCDATFAQNLTLEDGLMVAAPARSLHETLGDIITGPSTQLSGPMNMIQGAHCNESCLGMSVGGKSRSLSMSSLPGVSASTSLPLTFHTLAPSITPCVPVQVSATSDGMVTSHHHPHLAHATTSPPTPAPPMYPPLDLNSQTDSNHDTALTLACAGGHEELVSLLLSRGADIEHRDKKGFTPLMLAATAGHGGVVDILLNHASDIEAQSERTKDTALSLACSGGRYEVVDILLARGANKEHRNVSDYTPLSLAASGGYVNIIKLLLSHGAEINSRFVPQCCLAHGHRTGSKLGISPLMLAAMNGHTQAVKLLLDMGSDINAQIETNRNTALTLACFQGRHEVVSLLLDRKANVEHRAKTGLTPLMEAASGGYVEVGKVLIDKGADVNAPPVPSSRDTALTIAADKGHYRFVQLLLERDATVDVKNKKGNSPLWLAANGGHLEVVQLLCASNGDIDSQDNRKVSCLMAAFRKGHAKVVKWMVNYVSQFPSDQEMARYMTTITDKDLLKKCSQCVDTIRIAKEHQAAEANKNANILLEEIDLERCKEENRKAAAAKRREKKRKKKKEKQVQIQTSVIATEESKLEKTEFSSKHLAQSSQSEGEEEEDYMFNRESNTTQSNESSPSKSKPVAPSNYPDKSWNKEVSLETVVASNAPPPEPPRPDRKRDREKTKEKNKRNLTKSGPEPEKEVPKASESGRGSKKRHSKQEALAVKADTTGLVNGVAESAISDYEDLCVLFAQSASLRGKSAVDSKLGLDTFSDLALDLPPEVALSAGLRNPTSLHCLKSSLTNSVSPKKLLKRDEGWKEVVRNKLFNRSKKVSVPANAISRVIGRGGCNINAIREGSGAHIEVEKQKGQGDRTVIIRGSAESTRLAQQLITALIKEPDKELSEILQRCGLSRHSNSSSVSCPETFRTVSNVAIINPSVTSTAQVSTISSQNKNLTRHSAVTKSSGNLTFVTKAASIPPPSLPANATPPFTNQIRSVVTNTQNIRPGIPTSSVATPPFLNNAQNAWTGVVVTGKVPANIPRPSVPVCSSSTALSVTTVSSRVVTTTTVDKSPVVRQLFTENKDASVQPGSTTATKTTVSYTMAVIAQGKSASTLPENVITVTTKVTDTKVSTISPTPYERSGSAPPSSASHNVCSGPTSVQPFSSNHSPKVSNGPVVLQQESAAVQITGIQVSPTLSQSKPFPSSVVGNIQPSTSMDQSSPPLVNVVSNSQSAIAQEYSPFNNLFCKVAQSVWGQKDKEIKPNFASVAAVGVTSVAAQVQNSTTVQSTLTLTLPQNPDHELIVDAAKAPGYRGSFHISPSASSTSTASSNPSQSHSASFGPIGSGPRSAPCTPPLGPIGPPSSLGINTRRSTPPIALSPSPPPPHTTRSLPDSQTSMLHELPRSVAGGAGLPPQHISPQISEAFFHHQGLEMSSHPNRLLSYPMASTLASPGGTNTTFSQHSPLSSVGTILPEGANNGALQVVQSNLNPNAPDFSSRASLLMAQHGPSLHHLQPRLPNSFQENSAPPHITQFRPILASSASTFPLHALPTPHPQAINRFPFHHGHQQQAGDFNTGPAGGLPSGVGALSQGTDALPLLSMMPNYTPHPSQVVPGGSNVPHYPRMQSVIGIRPNQRSASSTPSVGTSSKDEGSPMAVMSPNTSPQGSNLPSPTGMNVQENSNPAGTIGEDRKLPRPIGMERAQRKNPMFGGVSDVGGIWSFSSSGRLDIPATGGDWIHNIPGGVNSAPMQQEETSGLPPAMHNNYGANRFADILALENNHTFDQSYQQTVSGGGYPFVNGLPPHMVPPHMFQNNTQDAQIEMWGVHPKVPLPSTGDGLPHQSVEHKLAWQNWSPHQT